jgi:nucleotide-binding universal stress UspA family protein
MIEIKRILIPTDFSEYSQQALKYAVALAQGFKAKLFVMHVWEHPVLSAPPAEIETYPPLLMTEEKKSQEEALNRLTADLIRQGIDAQPVFVTGRTYMEIVDKAKELEVDLITLATHGRTGLSHLVFGSTAEKIIRLAPCPVLTVKHPEHEFVK